MAAHQVRALLMGGQACVLYGAAEFSRDTDLAVLADAANWKRINEALDELRAKCVAVPSAEMRHLLRGHAVHFRCQHPEAEGMRVDVMSVMRGVDGFSALWERRTTLEAETGFKYELLSLPDLVAAKKTARDKDWPMIRRLLEADYFQNLSNADAVHIKFWLRELRTPELILELAKLHPKTSSEMAQVRPLLELAKNGKKVELEWALEAEEKLEREKDRLYWEPLKKELEQMRHALRSA